MGWLHLDVKIPVSLPSSIRRPSHVMDLEEDEDRENVARGLIRGHFSSIICKQFIVSKRMKAGIFHSIPSRKHLGIPWHQLILLIIAVHSRALNELGIMLFTEHSVGKTKMSPS